MLESLLASHCAPALAGIKPANMISCFKDRTPGLREEIDGLNKKLNKKDIYIDIICECPRRFLLMVYRKKKLTEQLNRKDISEFLEGFGYEPGGSLENYMEMLRRRMRFDCNFPHEIGAFLGYPLHDIYGYMEGKECLYTGEWKVYEDLEGAKKMFCRFRSCRLAIMRRLEGGQSLEQIFYAA